MNELNIYTKKKKNWKTKTSDVIPCYERHEHAALTFLSFHITLIAYGLVWFNFCDGWDHVWNEIHANTCFFFFFVIVLSTPSARLLSSTWDMHTIQSEFWLRYSYAFLNICSFPTRPISRSAGNPLHGIHPAAHLDILFLWLHFAR